VKAVLERLAETRGLSRSITVDHGPEFKGQALDAWAYERAVQLSFIRPGKPNKNAYIESFNAHTNADAPELTPEGQDKPLTPTNFSRHFSAAFGSG
jgi:transposase InsO family protein